MKRAENNNLKAEFTAWLNILAYRTKLNFIRNESKHTCNIPFEEADVKCYDSTEDNQQFEFQCEWLREVFDGLPASQRRILEMLYFEGKRVAEIASEMKCSQQNIYNQKSKALKFLRANKRMEDM